MLLIVCLCGVGDECGREAADGLILVLDGCEKLVEALERRVLKIAEGHVDAEWVSGLTLADLPGPDSPLIDIEDLSKVGATEAESFPSTAQADWGKWIAGHGVSCRRGRPRSVRPGASMIGSVEEALDVAADLFEDGEGFPDARVAVGQGLRLALGGDRVVDAVARAVGEVVLAENAGVVGLGVSQRNLSDLEAVGGEQLAILAAHADGGFNEGFAQIFDLIAGEALFKPFLSGLALTIDDEVAGKTVGVGVGDVGNGGHC
ncbi:hypothetical protein HMPREF1505_1729 [Prevotella sp. ICM33]|nr:hypothetical protein HMPREF1505_1729 [Prevotella sp. ICM33]